MKGKLLFILIVWGVSASADVFACGNKFLVASRGTRFGKVAVARQEASILVYANPDSAVPQAVPNVPVETVLVNAGYQPTVVADPEEFNQALSQGGWDLVLADLKDSATVQIQMGDEAPMVVPVLYEPTKSDYQQAKQEYDSVIKAPMKSQRFLESIDEAVAMSGD
jgi:hypothetical protein